MLSGPGRVSARRSELRPTVVVGIQDLHRHLARHDQDLMPEVRGGTGK